MYLMRLTDDGDILWTGTYGLTRGRREICYKIIQTNEGGYVLAGRGDERSSDFMLLKTKPDVFGWWTFPDSGFAEEDELEYDQEYFTERLHSPFYPDSLLEITIEGSENVHFEIIDDEVLFTAEPDFCGLDSILFIASEPDDGETDTTYLRLNIHPTNDLPEPYSIINPADSTVLDGWFASFRWETAVQNEWEVDTVRYNLHFRCGEEYYVHESIPDTSLDSLSMLELGDMLWIYIWEQEHEVEWWVSAVDDSGFTDSNEHFTFTIPTNAIEATEINIIPDKFELKPIYPNPFNSSVTINFELPEQIVTSIIIFDITGREIAKLVDSDIAAGHHCVIWNSGNNPSGTYLCRMEAGEFSKSLKLVLTR